MAICQRHARPSQGEPQAGEPHASASAAFGFQGASTPKSHRGAELQRCARDVLAGEAPAKGRHLGGTKRGQGPFNTLHIPPYGPSGSVEDAGTHAVPGQALDALGASRCSQCHHDMVGMFMAPVKRL